MSIQSELDEAIARIRADTDILHRIIHGDDKTTVETEGGLVSSPAKLLQEINELVATTLNDLSLTMGALQSTLAESQQYTNISQTQAQIATDKASLLNLPDELTGEAGKLLAVNGQENGYTLLQSKSSFYGFAKIGAKLVLYVDEPTQSTQTLDEYFIAQYGIGFEMDENGHLLMKL